MTGSGAFAPAAPGYWVETVGVGVDASIASGNYDNTLWYEAPDDFSKNSTNVNGYITYAYDLSDLGVAAGDSISSLYVSNFDVFSTVTAIDGLSGWISITGSGGNRIEGGSDEPSATKPVGSNSYYLDFPGFGTHYDTDPDLIYAGSIAVIPEPAAASLLLLTGSMLLARRNRGRTTA